MKLNDSQTEPMKYSLEVTRSPHAVNPITLRGNILKEYADIFRYGVMLMTWLLLLLLKKIGNAMPGEGDWHPISPKTPAPHYQPVEEKKRKGK